MHFYHFGLNIALELLGVCVKVTLTLVLLIIPDGSAVVRMAAPALLTRGSVINVSVEAHDLGVGGQLSSVCDVSVMLSTDQTRFTQRMFHLTAHTSMRPGTVLHQLMNSSTEHIVYSITGKFFYCILHCAVLSF